MTKPSIKAPRHLSRGAARWYEAVVAEYDLEIHHFFILEIAAGCWDRIQACRKILSKEGLVTRDRFGQVRSHPALNIERDQKTLFARLIRELGLRIDNPDAARPPRIVQTLPEPEWDNDCDDTQDARDVN